MKMFTRTSRLLAASTGATGWRAGTPFGNDNFLRIGAPLAAAVLVAFAVRERRQHNVQQQQVSNQIPASAATAESARTVLNETATVPPTPAPRPVMTEEERLKHVTDDLEAGL
jgi:hypothetical protein